METLMATITIDFTNYFSLDSDMRRHYEWQDWDTVYAGPGIYKANCKRVLERVSTNNSVTITYDSDTVLKKSLYKRLYVRHNLDSDAYHAYFQDSDQMASITYPSNLYVIDFNNKSHIDSEVTNYYFKV